MKKILLVLKTEIINVVTRRSFIILTFGLPIVAFVLFTVVTNLNQRNPQSLEGVFSEVVTGEEVEGYVDHSGIIKALPSDVSPERMVSFVDEASAYQALENGEVIAFYIIPEDVIETKEIVLIKPDFNPISANTTNWVMNWVFKVNLLNGDENLTAHVNHPLVVTRQPLEQVVERDDDNLLTFFVPYGTTMLFYFVILGSSSMLLGSVTKEKENQVIEVLMLSVSPTELLTGKIIGLGITGLLQTVIYSGLLYTLLTLSGRTSPTAAAIQLPPTILVWGIVFFILGYTLYASLMAGMGALVPNMREASQTTFVVIAPLIVPMFFMTVLIQKPYSVGAIILSLFPLTAPVSMMTRLAVGGIPIWQPILAAVLMVITAILIIRAVSGLFRAQTLLSGQEFKLKLFFQALLGRA